jgi:type IV secretion system protein VirB10
MPVTEIGDPRLHALFGANDPRDAGVRPTIRLPRKGLPPISLVAIALVFGVLLFVILNGRRTTQIEPTVKARPDSDASAWASPPPLYLPPEVAPLTHPLGTEERPAPESIMPLAPAPVVRVAPVQPVYVHGPIPQIAPAPPTPQPRSSTGAPLVIDTEHPPSSASGGPAGSAGTFASLVPQGDTSGRMRASSLANRSTTITQGTLIQAVLETGFDSTQPGFARAVVSRDVRSFDGINVLIPRGSKLIGQYRSDVGQGQKRAVIIWTRLIRPDGMTIAMDSPAVDTVGRGGVAANVNTHFFAKLGDALLQTTLGIGGALAQQRISGPVVVLSNNTTAAAGQAAAPTNSYVPTLTVPAGKSISVFVAHDLDFTTAGGAG